MKLHRALLAAPLLLAAAFLFMGVQPASACGCICTSRICGICPVPSFDTFAPPGKTTLTMLSPTHGIIEVGEYATASMPIAGTCSAALAPVPGIVSVNRIRLIDPLTGSPLPWLDAWKPSDGPDRDFAVLAVKYGDTKAISEGWQGFASPIAGGTPEGVPFSFQLDVTFKPGTSVESLVAALKSHGMLGNGSANPDGSLDYMHYFLRRLGDGEIQVVFPPDRMLGSRDVPSQH